MDYTNNSKDKSEIDLREVFNYLLKKVWIIALVVVGFAVISFLYTSLFVTPLYTSTSNMFIISTASGSETSSAGNWSIGKQLAKSAPEFITLDFCNDIAEKMNADEYDCEDILGEGVKFSDYYKSLTGKDKISGAYILSSLKVTSDEETCIIKFRATTSDPKMSAVITNVVSTSFEAHYKVIINSDSVRTSITDTGKVPTSPSNIHKMRNVVLAALIGFVAACAVLVVIFMLDDKI
ncbi:MAG: YveK family protein, partial [Eubacteriales bacterium]